MQLTQQQLDILDVRFVYHAPRGDQPKRYELVRSYCRDLAKCMMENCPESRELSVALTHLDAAAMFANAAIARNEARTE